MAKVRVLFIGLDPKVIDYSNPDQSSPGLTAEKVQAAIDGAVAQLRAARYEVEVCPIDYGATAEATVRARLAAARYDCVVIGAGVRLFPKQTALFETLVNLVHTEAPAARFAFNTSPSATAEAVQRWFPQAEQLR